MKKLTVLAVSLFMISAFLQISYARQWYKTYEVKEFKENGIVILDENGETFLIEKDRDGLEVGDIVRYDGVRNILHKSPWQLAKIVEITDGTITIKLTNGKKLEVGMRNSYQGQFSPGEEVLFQESDSELIKTGFHFPEEK